MRRGERRLAAQVRHGTQARGAHRAVAPPTSEPWPVLSFVANFPMGAYVYECRAGDEWKAKGTFAVLDFAQPWITIQVKLERAP